MIKCEGFKLTDNGVCENYIADSKYKESCRLNCKIYEAKGKVAKYDDMEAIVD